MRGLAELGSLTGDPRCLDWARLAYQYYNSNAFDTGWLPEICWLPDHNNHTEMCLVGDMTEIEVWLARAGWPAYWDRVDRTIRNLIVPGQFVLTPAMEAMWREVNKDKPAAEVARSIQLMKDFEGGFLRRADSQRSDFRGPLQGRTRRGGDLSRPEDRLRHDGLLPARGDAGPVPGLARHGPANARRGAGEPGLRSRRAPGEGHLADAASGPVPGGPSRPRPTTCCARRAGPRGRRCGPHATASRSRSAGAARPWPT